MANDDGWKPISPKDFAARVQGEPPIQPEVQPAPVFSQRSSGGTPETSQPEARLGGSLEDNLRRQLAFLGNPAIIEIQSLGWRRRKEDTFERTRAAHATTIQSAITLCEQGDAAESHGVYLIPATLHPGVDTRNSVQDRWHELVKGSSTVDPDVAARLVLAVDFDVKRPTGISASDEEMSRSIEIATRAYDYLAAATSPDCLAYIHSGNGRQIHIALDHLPNDEPMRDLCAGLLIGFDALWSTPQVNVDKKLFDAKRILPACGTVKKKGSVGIPSRPHRRTAIVTPEKVRRLSREELRQLALKVFGDISSNEAACTLMNKTIVGNRTPASSPLPPPKAMQLTPAPDSPFALARAVDPHEVAGWLGILDANGQPTCPGCGSADSGVVVLDTTTSGAKGLKCSHNRCQGKGKPPGFRTNIDLVMEVRGVDNFTATKLLGERFGFEVQAPTTPNPAQVESRPKVSLKKLNDILPAAMARVLRRAEGQEKPIPLPWPSLAAHYGGGWWPGVHFICSGTGIGKTAAALQMAMHSAKEGFPVAYIGLELEEMQIALRLVGEWGHVPWSPLYTGSAPPGDIGKAQSAMLDLMAQNLPFFPIFSRPQGWPPSELLSVAEAIRAEYPEGKDEDGTVVPGSRPIMLVLDFLQIIGEEHNDPRELRERIGRAAYLTRYIAAQLNMVVIVISSIARDKYSVLSRAFQEAGIDWEESTDTPARPIKRRMKNPDALVGLGKESGDIEFSGDSVSAIARIPGSDDVLWATAKGRATGASWSPMRFTGFRYEESPDGGAGLIAGLRSASQKKAEAKDTATKEKDEAAFKNAVEVARYILTHPKCSVSAARKETPGIGDASGKWDSAIAILKDGIIRPGFGGKGGLRVDRSKLPKSVLDAIGDLPEATLETLEAT